MLQKKSINLKTEIPGPKSKQLSEDLKKLECPEVTYFSDNFPVFWEKALGSIVEDVDGNEYIDFTSAFGVATIGHTHHSVVSAINDQSKKLIHGMGDVHPTRQKMLLASLLSKVLPKGLGFPIFGCSGSDAVEAALKTVFMATKKIGIIAFTGAYHGLTAGSLSLTSRREFRSDFQNMQISSVHRVPYPYCYRCPLDKKYPECGISCLKYVEYLLSSKSSGVDNIGGLFIEPIQGRGGIVVPPAGYLKALSELCHKHNILVVYDEIFTGFCRTSSWFSCQNTINIDGCYEEEVIPDIMCIGKALGGGLPISACVGKEEVMSLWPKSSGEAIHTSTFLGNPIACATAIASINVMESEKLCDKAKVIEKEIFSRLHNWAERFKEIGDIRGRGGLIGIELVLNRETKEPATLLSLKIMDYALKNGVMILPEGPDANILGFIPPLNIPLEALHEGLDVIEQAFIEFSV